MLNVNISPDREGVCVCVCEKTRAKLSWKTRAYKKILTESLASAAFFSSDAIDETTGVILNFPTTAGSICPSITLPSMNELNFFSTPTYLARTGGGRGRGGGGIFLCGSVVKAQASLFTGSPEGAKKQVGVNGWWGKTTYGDNAGRAYTRV